MGSYGTSPSIFTYSSPYLHRHSAQMRHFDEFGNDLGSRAARVGTDLAQPSSPLWFTVLLVLEDHYSYRFQAPGLPSTKYLFLHPLHFNPLV